MGVSIPELLQENWPTFKENDLTKECTYKSMLESDYDGGVVTKPVDSEHPLDIIFKNIQESLIDGSTIKSIDRIALFPVLDLPVNTKINDLIVDPSLTEWEVKAIVKDPADAAYRLRVRPING